VHTRRRQSSIAWGLLLATLSACGGDEVISPAPMVEPYDPPAPFRVAGEQPLTGYVNPMVGTQGAGNVIPGALVPHGVVRASPDTNSETGSIDAYDYDDERIEGFTHLHLEGPGASNNGYNQLRLMPTLGEPAFPDVSSTYDHASEVTEPGYYAVTLEDTGIRAELTATGHAAVHRYAFPDGAPKVVLDLGASNGATHGGRIEVVDDHSLRGVAEYSVHPGVAALLWDQPSSTAESKVYFHIRFDERISKHGVWQRATPTIVSPGASSGEGAGLGAWVEFEQGGARTIEARVGISLVDAELARANAEAQLGGESFDALRGKAADAWNAKLNRIQIEAPEPLRTTFYTALYHSLFQPADYTESDGRYPLRASGDFAVANGGGRPFYLDDWCMWDTYRTSHPLGSLVEPEIRSDVVRSMLTLYREGGWLPKCTWNATGYSRVMTGNPAVAIIVDAWTRGLRDFDAELAWQAMVKSSDQDSADPVDGACGYLNLGTPRDYLELGYVAHECDITQAASMTLEHAYDDFCMAEFAADRAMGEDEARYRKRADNFRAHFDPDSGFMRPKMRDGSWLEPFDPADRAEGNSFVEASAWIFTFFVPHDVPALIELVGGDEAFVALLDRFFAEGHFDVTNQPSFHIPWLYNYAGAPHRTQELVRSIALEHFGAGPDGLPGNDDAGSMSAWLVLAALGIYPVAPGSPVWQLSAPLVDRAVLHLNPHNYDGAAFVIETERVGEDAIYVQSATLDGEPLERSWLHHEEIVRGGTLHFVLGPAPSAWAAD
jgi:predicted alpha-1,2-mannosidase